MCQIAPLSRELARSDTDSHQSCEDYE